MHRLGSPVMALAALLAMALAGNPPTATAEAPMFQFPHLDRERRIAPPDALSFGTLLDSTPEGLESLHEIPDSLLYDALRPDDPLRDLVLAGSFSQAITLAQRRVEMLEGEAQREAIARARVDWGLALHFGGQHGPATQQLERGLSVARPGEKWFDERWVGALLALGLSQQTLGRHNEADRSLIRAQNLIQRHYGATDGRQLPLLLARAQSLAAQEEDFSTEQLYRTHLKLIKKDTSALSSRRVAAVHLLAEWLVEQGRFKHAISAFNQLLEDQQLADPSDESREAAQARVAAMTGLSQVFLRSGSAEVDRGLTLAQEAANLVDQNPAAFEPAEAAAAHLFAGDWLTLFSRRRLAAEQYRLAWQRAAESPEAEALQAALGKPALIFDGPEIPLGLLGYQWANDHVFANFQLEVRADGRPARVHLTGSNLHATNIRRAQQLLRYARFRPALDDGEPVASDMIRHHRVYNTEPFTGFGQVQAGGNVMSSSLQTSPVPRRP
ncbi:MAG: hypothetical protein AAF736_10525 [Pseudomonadota bacterium]